MISTAKNSNRGDPDVVTNMMYIVEAAGPDEEIERQPDEYL